MARIILILDNKENRRLLSEFLGAYHSIGEHEAGQPLEEAFDLCVIDDPNLTRFRQELEGRRDAEQPGILPVLLVTHRPDVWSRIPYLWQLVDESIMVPVAKVELQSRVEILLRARRISLDLKLRNEDLEAFIQAMSHDLRASLRAVTMFAEALSTGEKERFSEDGRQDLDRIRWAAQEMRELIDSLLNFSRLGRGEVRYEPIDLKVYIETCLRNLQAEINNRHAHIKVKGRARTVQADPTLLKIALTNLLSNAIKFVPEGVEPEITVSACVKHDLCRIEINDNGVGISQADQQRIFMPFVRIYSEQEFPGIGLGLPSVRKAVELMGGRVGVESRPGQGSRFWIELAM
ncbi:MAG TPA: HAMP domain-containing sensor histidine kinase [Terriglobia bacterium]|jgi:signal transduction histidine kinase